MNPHFVEIPRAFRDEQVEYLVIGAHALAAHGHVQATLDIDLWVRPTEENARRTWRALERFRAPLAKMKIGDFAEPQVLYQIGLPRNRGAGCAEGKKLPVSRPPGRGFGARETGARGSRVSHQSAHACGSAIGRAILRALAV